MERLTRTETHQKIIYTLGHTRWAFDKCDHSRLQDLFDWLFAYQALGPVEELTALVKARDEGRVVVLPCEVGDTVYEVTKGLSLYKPGLHTYVHEGIATELDVFTWARRGDFGKTVFLTSAEAEAALSCRDCRESGAEKVCEDKRTGYVCPNKAALSGGGGDV